MNKSDFFSSFQSCYSIAGLGLQAPVVQLWDVFGQVCGPGNSLGGGLVCGYLESLLNYVGIMELMLFIG